MLSDGFLLVENFRLLSYFQFNVNVFYAVLILKMSSDFTLKKYKKISIQKILAS